jgi:hypothetical protein
MIMMLMFGYSTMNLGNTIRKIYNKSTNSLLNSYQPSNPVPTASKLIIRTPNYLYFLTLSITTQKNIPNKYKDALIALSVLYLAVKLK